MTATFNTTELLAKTAPHVALDGNDNDSHWPPEVRNKLLAEFFFDVDKLIDWHVKRAKWSALGMTLLPGLSCMVSPAYWANAITQRQNMTEIATSMHVGLTAEELIFNTGSYGGLCRFDFQKRGARSVIIPLNRITDLAIEMPAGGLFPPRVLSNARIQTAGQGAVSSEVCLVGLIDADHFRRTILALRHGEPLPEPRDPKAARLYRQPPIATPKTSLTASDAMATSSSSVDAVAATQTVETIELLKEVNKNLVAMRQLMQQQQQQASQRTTSTV